MDDYDGVSEHGLRPEPRLLVVIRGLYLVRSLRGVDVDPQILTLYDPQEITPERENGISSAARGFNFCHRAIRHTDSRRKCLAQRDKLFLEVARRSSYNRALPRSRYA